MSAPPPLPPGAPGLDLRKLSVAKLLTGITYGQAWAWKLMQQLVATSAQVSRRHARRDTPAPIPALVGLKNNDQEPRE